MNQTFKHVSYCVYSLKNVRTQVDHDMTTNYKIFPEKCLWGAFGKRKMRCLLMRPVKLKVLPKNSSYLNLNYTVNI